MVRSKGDKRLQKKTPVRWVEARRRELLKAGYLEDEIINKEYGVHIGLGSVSLKRLGKSGLLKHRRNEIANYMREYGETRSEAIKRARTTMRLKGFRLGFVGDYIIWYRRYPVKGME